MSRQSYRKRAAVSTLGRAGSSALQMDLPHTSSTAFLPAVQSHQGSAHGSIDARRASNSRHHRRALPPPSASRAARSTRFCRLCTSCKGLVNKNRRAHGRRGAPTARRNARTSESARIPSRCSPVARCASCSTVSHAYPPLIENEHVRAALLDVRAIQQWARTTGADVTPDGIARLRLAIAAFSASWRAAQLPTTPKLHLVEQHVADLIEQQGGWGERGEQALEATHKLGVAADHRCFGANAERGLEFFLKHQLAIALADTQNLLPKNAHVQSTLLDEEETYY